MCVEELVISKQIFLFVWFGSMVILIPFISDSYYIVQDSWQYALNIGSDMKHSCFVPDIKGSGSEISLLNMMFYSVRKRISFDRYALYVKEVAFSS